MADKNKQILLDILENRTRGPQRDVTLINAAAVLVAAGVADDFRDGLLRATESLDSGAAYGVLESVVAFGRKRASARG